MANQYDTNLKLQAIADAIGNTQSSGLIQALEDIADAVAGGGGGGSSTAGLVSDNFSETDTYDLGDYCIHNNTLYVCINAITTPGAWDLSDWQATNAGIQLSSLNSAISTLNSSLNNYIRTAEYSTSISTTANESFGANIDATMQGYTLLGVAGIMLLSGAAYVYRLNAVQYNGENNIYISGYSIGTVTISVRVVALYKKSLTD